MMNDIERQYYSWLCSLIFSRNPARRQAYSRLIAQLYDTPFRYWIAMDRYRLQDGINLRYTYKDMVNMPSDIFQDHLNYRHCTVLEFMIALASRLEFIMMDTDLGDQTGMWFWEMIENLDLDEFSDTTYNQAEVARRLDILLDRMYSPEGYGGLFPMCPCPADFTKTEIWQQAMYYLDRKAYGSTKEAF